MCRTPALAATVLALFALPALAAEPGKAQSAAPTQAAAPPARAKAAPQQRAEARRMDPLARAAFWGREMEIDGRDTEAAIGLSQALRQLDRNDEAADVAGRGLVVAPDNVELLMESARAAVARGQGFYAIEPARKAQALAPRDWRPLALLAVAMLLPVVMMPLGEMYLSLAPFVLLAVYAIALSEAGLASLDAWTRSARLTPR